MDAFKKMKDQQATFSIVSLIAKETINLKKYPLIKMQGKR
jgi:hypothetical protein